MALVCYFGPLRDLTGCREEEVEAQSLAQVLKVIQDKYGSKAGQAAREASVYMNGVNWLFVPRGERRLKVDSVLDLFPPVAGG
jgi:molybdopterin converting factor small subunit